MNPLPTNSGGGIGRAGTPYGEWKRLIRSTISFVRASVYGSPASARATHPSTSDCGSAPGGAR